MLNAKTQKTLQKLSIEDLLKAKDECEKALVENPNAVEAQEELDFINQILALPASVNPPGAPAVDPNSELGTLRLQNARLLAENTALKKAPSLDSRIKEKMAAGLNREQAETVVKQQAEHDAYLVKQEKDQAETRAASK